MILLSELYDLRQLICAFSTFCIGACPVTAHSISAMSSVRRTKPTSTAGVVHPMECSRNIPRVKVQGKGK